jgi:hypothetical protein
VAGKGFQFAPVQDTFQFVRSRFSENEWPPRLCVSATLVLVKPKYQSSSKFFPPSHPLSNVDITAVCLV